jgi:hypothetical protein
MRAKNKVAFLVFLILIPVIEARAQLTPLNESGRIFISISPESPLPGSIVRLFATSQVIDLERSDIVWYADKKLIAEGQGLTEVSAPVGPLGSEVAVVVIAQGRDGGSATGEAFITPTEIDILWESDSYVPPFYKGRALPSAGTKLRMQAMARLQLPDGSTVPDNEIIYTWRRNGTVIQTSSGRGRSFAIFPAPTLFSKDTFSVEAVAVTGARSGKASVTIPSIEPQLILYEDHPLLGILYSNAFGQSTSVRDAEMTFAAVPYFAEANSSDDSQLVYKWQVNGRPINADYSRPSEITINADRSDGNARLALSLTRLRNLYMKVSGAWDISFPAGASGTSGTDPFSAANQ